MKIHLSDRGFGRKPTKREAGIITNEITRHVCDVNIKEFAKAVGEEGRAFTPALFKGSRKRENFKCQQAFVLDFDGGISPEEFMEKAEKYEIASAVLYETFSSTVECPKFRVVFFNDVVIEDRRAAEIINKMLCFIFEEADQSCKDVSRMFYGGKKIIYCEEGHMIDIYNIALSLQAYIKEKDSHNYRREIQKVAYELGVALDGKNLLGIYNEKKIEENRAEPSIIIQGRAQNSSKVYTIELENHTTHTTPQGLAQKKKCKQLRNKGFKDIYNVCRLFRDLYEKQDIPHEYKFLLASNLCHIKGGRKLFFDGLKQHQSKWNMDWRYMVERDYQPMSCKKGGCPYADLCGDISLIKKLSRSIQKIETDDVYIKLTEAESLLEKYLVSAIKSPQKGIHLIKAQTALGKTAAYCRLLVDYQWQKPVMIVVPTIKLQQEICGILGRQGVHTFMTPNMEMVLKSIDLEELACRLKELYDSGYGYKVKEYLTKYIIRNKDDLSEMQIKRIYKYLNFKESLNGAENVITTHAMFLSLDKEIISQYEIIIDEDILMTIFKGTASIGFRELQTVLKSNAIPEDIRQRIMELLELPDGSTGKTGMRELYRAEADIIYEKKLPIWSSLPGFIGSDTFSIDKKEELIYYFKAAQIPEVKMIIVSATLNTKVYEDYCRGRNRICSVEMVPFVRYKGKLKQYTAFSMSRSFIDDVGYQNVLADIKRMIGKERINLITFKKYSQGDIYFGKTEGFNQYKGQDLIVLGTPHAQPILYKLLGCYFGYCVEEVMTVHRTSNNGYEFPIMTFDKKDLQNLQFYFLESELEQAVGRARLLRCDCTVYLFSNYPCRGAEIIQEQYLDIDRIKRNKDAA